LPPNERRITLRRRAWRIPPRIAAGGTVVVPFLAGEEIGWAIED
jgi:dihydroorotase